MAIRSIKIALHFIKLILSANLLTTTTEFLIKFLFILAVFGYKLYRSLTERERRREEKLRAKTQKKKK